MKIQAPPPRYGTAAAIEVLAAILDLPNDGLMQDWSYEVADSSQVDAYLLLYKQLTDEDERFVLMEMIIQAIEDQPTQALMDRYCELLRPKLSEDFELHTYTIFYWASFDNDDLEGCWRIAPYMRQVWQNHTQTPPSNRP
ncbi:MAG TPA: hypothetical protein DCS93_42190 [Microscillaceae bacterium]|nr:hypothetical protein [Microscillaceae bacterium]